MIFSDGTDAVVTKIEKSDVQLLHVGGYGSFAVLEKPTLFKTPLGTMTFSEVYLDPKENFSGVILATNQVVKTPAGLIEVAACLFDESKLAYISSSSATQMISTQIGILPAISCSFDHSGAICCIQVTPSQVIKTSIGMIKYERCCFYSTGELYCLHFSPQIIKTKIGLLPAIICSFYPTGELYELIVASGSSVKVKTSAGDFEVGLCDLSSSGCNAISTFRDNASCWFHPNGALSSVVFPYGTTQQVKTSIGILDEIGYCNFYSDGSLQYAGGDMINNIMTKRGPIDRYCFTRDGRLDLSGYNAFTLSPMPFFSCAGGFGGFFSAPDAFKTGKKLKPLVTELPKKEESNDNNYY